MTFRVILDFGVVFFSSIVVVWRFAWLASAPIPIILKKNETVYAIEAGEEISMAMQLKVRARATWAWIMMK